MGGGSLFCLDSQAICCRLTEGRVSLLCWPRSPQSWPCRTCAMSRQGHSAANPEIAIACLIQRTRLCIIHPFSVLWRESISCIPSSEARTLSGGQDSCGA